MALIAIPPGDPTEKELTVLRAAAWCEDGPLTPAVLRTTVPTPKVGSDSGVGSGAKADSGGGKRGVPKPCSANDPVPGGPEAIEFGLGIPRCVIVSTAILLDESLTHANEILDALLVAGYFRDVPGLVMGGNLRLTWNTPNDTNPVLLLRPRSHDYLDVVISLSLDGRVLHRDIRTLVDEVDGPALPCLMLTEKGRRALHQFGDEPQSKGPHPCSTAEEAKTQIGSEWATYQQLSVVMGIPESTIRGRVSRFCDPESGNNRAELVRDVESSDRRFRGNRLEINIEKIWQMSFPTTSKRLFRARQQKKPTQPSQPHRK